MENTCNICENEVENGKKCQYCGSIELDFFTKDVGGVYVNFDVGKDVIVKLKGGACPEGYVKLNWPTLWPRGLMLPENKILFFHFEFFELCLGIKELK